MIQEKYQHLQNLLCSMGRIAVAFSSGVDSTFLLSAAHEVLGDDVIAITASANAFPQREQEEAAAFCRSIGVKQHLLAFQPLQVEGFAQNPPNRCYVCKRALFEGILRIAGKQGCAAVCEGSNMDDLGDYRPGLMAIQELGIRSPLREAGLTKAEIRQLSREMGLPTWSKPSFACLASRFPYGETITAEKLAMVEQAELLLLELGFRQERVRIHGDSARIELLPEEFPRLLEGDVRERICRRFKELGFRYVSLDLQGYRTGSMNEVLNKKERTT